MSLFYDQNMTFLTKVTLIQEAQKVSKTVNFMFFSKFTGNAGHGVEHGLRADEWTRENHEKQ